MRPWTALTSAVLPFAAAGIALATPGAAAAATLEILYSFPDSGQDSALTIGPRGVIYGVTTGLGAISPGALYSLTPPTAAGRPWAYRRLKLFAADKLGLAPLGKLWFGAGGFLYGTAQQGGRYYSFCCNLGGVVFQMKPPVETSGAWRYRVIANFGLDQDKDGWTPIGGVTPDGAGAFLGMTNAGAVTANQTNWGTIYRIATTSPVTGAEPWRRSLVHDFGATFYSDSDYTANPQYRLLRARNGRFYGTAVGGVGTAINGAVFRLDKAAGTWTYRPVVSLPQDASLGSAPLSGLVEGRWGVFYTVAENGGPSGLGTVLRVVGKTVTVGHVFKGAPRDGARPVGELLVGRDGALYGVTLAGGRFDKGTIYRLAPPPAGGTRWTYSILHHFTGNQDGSFPRAGLVQDRLGWLYGTSAIGAADGGALYRLKP